MRKVLIVIVIVVIIVVVYIIYKNQRRIGQYIQANTGNNPFNDYTVPLGIRNNNPLNIRHEQAIKWQGEIITPIEKNGDFAVFSDLEHGIRASEINLRSYLNEKVNTIPLIITKWAPPKENDDESYIKIVLSKMGSKYNRNTVIVKSDIPLLAWAMSNVEVGEKFAPSLVVFQNTFTKYNI